MEKWIRLAAEEDGEEILEIYAPYVKNTAITFETQVPSPEEFRERIRSIRSAYPYLVWGEGERIQAYAYACRHQERDAYRYDVDLAVYARPECHGRGGAAALYRCLFEILEAQGFHKAYACYTVPNEKSRRFHEKAGFREIATFPSTGYKLGGWYSVTWMERVILPPCPNPGPLRRVDQLAPGFVDEVLKKHAGMG